MRVNYIYDGCKSQKKQLKNMSWSIESIFLIDLLFSLRRIHGPSHMQDGPAYIYKQHV